MQNYKLKNRLSHGAFGTVYEADVVGGPLIGQKVAIKQVYNSQNVQREIQILKQIPAHINIVKFIQILSDAHNMQKNIVMQKGIYDLDQLIQSLEYPIEQKIVKIVAKGVLQGLDHLHSQGFIHRDLKPSNIMIKQGMGTVALCDFGSAVKCTTGEDYPLQGFTKWYKCPEMLFGSRKYKFQVDIWSLGCILVEIASGEPLFAGRSQIQQIALISNFLGDPSPKNWPSVVNLHDYGKINFIEKTPKSQQTIAQQLGISKQLVAFLMRMVKYQGRSTAKQLLQDPYLQNIQKNKQGQLRLGLFGTSKIAPKIIR